LVGHHLGHHIALVAFAASAVGMVIQASIFALASLGVMQIVRLRMSKRLLIAAFAPPLGGLLVVGALTFPYYILSDDEAGLLLSISMGWLGFAVLVAGTTVAVRRNSGAY
jgi:hypothetical protein